MNGKGFETVYIRTVDWTSSVHASAEPTDARSSTKVLSHPMRSFNYPDLGVPAPSSGRVVAVLRLAHTLWRSEKIERSVDSLPAGVQFFREQCDGLSMFDDGLLSGSTGARQSAHSGTISGVLRSDRSSSSPSLGSWPHEVAPDLASAKSVRPDRSSCAGTPCEEWSIHLTVYYMHKSCATSGRDSLSVGVPVIEHTPKAHLGEPSS